MNAITYPRVSTQDQADRGTSLPTQAEACRMFAQAEGWSLVAIASSRSLTELDQLDRPGLGLWFSFENYSSSN